MRRQHHIGAVLATGAFLILTPALAQPSFAQAARQPAAAAKDDNRPIPRLPDGHVSFEAPPGEKGVWNRQDYRPFIPTTVDETALRDRAGNNNDGPPGLKPKASDVPFQPWARSLFLYRQTHEIEPYGRCKPAGGFRNMATPYGTEFVQVPEQQRMYIFRPGASQHRDHWTAARIRSPILVTTATRSAAGGIPSSSSASTNAGGSAYGPQRRSSFIVEKWTRLDFKTLRYEITIDDPGAYGAV